MSTLITDNLIILDEAGCHLNMTLSYARANGGDRIKMPSAFIKGPKLSIIGAVSTKGIEASMYGEWNTDGEIFTVFVKELLVPRLSAGKIVIMDNVKFHSSSKAVKAIEDTGANIIFLPPYSPEFSPIENMWSKVKQTLRKLEPRSCMEFRKAIKTVFLQITQSDLLGWFKHCGYCVAQ